MSVSDVLKAHMDAVRSTTGLSEKMNLSESTERLNDFSRTPNQLLIFPKVCFGELVSVQEGISQTIEFDYQGFYEILPYVNQFLDVKKGETLRQSFLLKSNTEITVFFISFFAESTGHQLRHANIIKITDGLYKISADYTPSQDVRIRILDLYQNGLPAGHTKLTFSQPFVGIISQM